MSNLRIIKLIFKDTKSLHQTKTMLIDIVQLESRELIYLLTDPARAILDALPIISLCGEPSLPIEALDRL